MKLSELNAKLTDRQLSFRCPACQGHYIVIPVDRVGNGSGVPAVWTAKGEINDLTIRPSIDANTPPSCRWHGFITNGEILTC